MYPILFLLPSEPDTRLNLESDNLLADDDSPNESPQTTAAFWSFAFYQQYFNVNDEMVSSIWCNYPIFLIEIVDSKFRQLDILITD